MKRNELINDPRLTATMEHCRSHETQLFREKKQGDRTFISRENCDLALKHEDQSMYAKLIDGVWWWVCGCEECNGRERNSTKSYIECDKHNVCNTCGIHRSEVKEAWGGFGAGWMCETCKEKRDIEARKAAFDALDGEEPDTLCQDEIICPHCGSEISDHDIYEDEEMDCEICGGKFSLKFNPFASYSTSVIGKRITK